MLASHSQRALTVCRALLTKGIALCLLLLLGGAPAHGQIKIVQSAGKDAGTISSTTLAFPSSNSAGNWIGVVVRAGKSGQTIKVSDSNKNTYQQAIISNVTVDTPGGDTLAIFYAENIAGGVNTVTVSDSILGTMRIAILEASGVASSASLDGTPAFAQGTNNAPSSGSLTTAQSGDLVLGAIATADPETYIAASGYSVIQKVPTSGSKLVVEGQVQATAGAILANATLSASDPWGASVAAFKAGTPAPTITATSGTPQSTVVGTAFAAPLVVTLKDGFGSPLAGVTVTFTPPGSGASGTFAGGVDTAVTNATGVATSGTFTANSTAGTFNVTATASGVVTPAKFVLTNVGSGISLVQSAQKDEEATVTSSSLVFPAANIRGNWIGVVVRAGNSGETIKVSDSNNNTYQQAILSSITTDMPNGDTLAIFYAENVAPGSNTVMVSDNISASLRFVILEYSGVATSGSIDGTPSFVQGTGTAPNSGNVTTTQNGDLLLSGIATADIDTYAPGSGYKIEGELPTGKAKVIVEDQIQGTAGVVFANATVSDSDPWGASLAAFKPATGGVTPPTLPPSISKAFAAASIPLNGTTSLTLTITNPNAGGTSPLAGISFTDSMPSGLVIAPTPSLSNTCGGAATATAGATSMSLSGGTLAAGASCVVSANVQGTTAGVKNNSVQVSSTNGGTGNTGSATLQVNAPSATTTTPAGASVTFNTAVQNITLSATVTSSAGTVNAGTVTFTVAQGGTTIGTPVTSSTVASGAASATFSVPAGTAAGSYTITAAYSGGGTFSASSGTSTLTVSPAATTTIANSGSVTFNTAAQNVSLSASVTSSSGTVGSGAVTFSISNGGTQLGTSVAGTVSGGSASAVFSVPAGTPAGTYTITAAYGGTANLNISSDATHTLTVSQASTTTTAANASASFSSSAQNVNLSATVTSPSGTVSSGTVTFTVSSGGTTIGTPVSGTVASGSASAIFVLPASTTSGSYTITAAYSGTTNLLASSDATHTLTVGSGATTTTASNASLTFNTAVQNITLSATVTSSAGTVNAGTVTFTVAQGGTTIGTPVTSGTVASGAASATFSVPAGTAAGSYTISAAYSGGGGFATSTDSTHALTISPAATTTAAAGAFVSFNTGAQNVTLSAKVGSTSGIVNSGTVTFTVSQGSIQIGMAVTSGTIASNTATAVFSVPAGTAVGSYTITATYNGSTNFATSSDNTQSLTVAQASTATTAANASASFSTSAQNVTLTASVTSSSGPVNSGTVTFTVSSGGTTIGTPASGTVASGSASATFVLPASTTSGSYTITAAYSGTTNLLASSDATHTLTVGSGATTTTASNASVTFNTAAQSVTLSATVTSGAGTVNAGTITFTVSQGATTIGAPVTSGTVASGAASATFSVPAGTAAGSYTISAAYSGGGGFSASNGSASLTVSPAATTTAAVSLSLAFNTVAQNVTLSANVTSPSGSVNSGTVTFTVSQGATTIGMPTISGTVTSGAASATFPVPPSAAVGSYTITASYSGTANLSASSDATQTLTVNQASTTTTASSVTATVSSTAQNVTLSATVASPSGPVNSGTVSFTVSQSGTQLGTSVTSSTVASGAASATFSIPANTTAGTYTLTATYSGTSNLLTSSDATQTLTIGAASTPFGVITWHNDNMRSGLNPNETTLTTANVNSTTFGKVGEFVVNGRIDSEILYASQVTIPGVGVKNVIYFATENDIAYAVDADSISGSSATILWSQSLVPSGEAPATLQSGCGNISPNGVTATPVIDRSRNAIYLVAMTMNSASVTTQFDRIHALDLGTGNELFGGPMPITATFPGTAGNVSNGVVTFDPVVQHERAALLEVGNNIYTTWAGMAGDCNVFSGWIISYDADTLANTGAIDVSPNAIGGALWNSGGGPAADAAGSVYAVTGISLGFTYTTVPANNYPNSVLRLSTSSGSLQIADYWTQFNAVALNNSNLALAAASILLLPDVTDNASVVHHLAVVAGKDGKMYVLSRDNLGQYNTTQNNIVQTLALGSSGNYSTPVYFNNTVYACPANGPVEAYAISNALLTTPPSSKSTLTFGGQGCMMSVSSNGTSNGILWVIDGGGGGILHAYDATNLATLLYAANQASGNRDQTAPVAGHFISPVVANGKLYFGTGSTVAVYGLLP